MVSPGSIGFVWVRSGVPRGSRVHPGSRMFTRAILVVAVFIPVYVGSLERIKGSLGSFGFALVHLVVSGSIPVSVGSLGSA